VLCPPGMILLCLKALNAMRVVIFRPGEAAVRCQYMRRVIAALRIPSTGPNPSVFSSNSTCTFSCGARATFFFGWPAPSSFLFLFLSDMSRGV
jgi:hypothetical protein